MSPRRVLAILVKDLRDAWRDGRILVLLLLPIGGGRLLRDRQRGDAADDDDRGRRPTRRRRVARAPRPRGQEREDRAERAPDAEAARTLVAERGGRPGRRRRPGGRSARGDPRGRGRVADGRSRSSSSSPIALARAAGNEPPARPPVHVVAGRGPEARRHHRIDPFDELFAILLFVIFVAMMVVPMQTADELETGTFAALRLAAKGSEILAAKALAGYIYGAAASP